MRRFLTTLLAATAIAAPAAAATDRPDTDGPRGRTHAGQRDSDAPDRPSADTARPSGGEDRPAARPRFERPAFKRPAVERQAAERPTRPDRGPPEWKMESREGTADRVDRSRRPRIDTIEPARTNSDMPVRTPDRVSRPSRDVSAPVTVQHRDRPDGAFNRPSPTGTRTADHRQWTRDWRTDRRYDWRAYRDHNRSAFRVGFYTDPYGTAYRRWNIGWSMRPNYYRSAYWINDPWQYRLPEVYGPYRWVRYYDDAILVNSWTGEVVDVIYNFFW